VLEDVVSLEDGEEAVNMSYECEHINYAHHVRRFEPIALHSQGCTKGTYLYAVKGLFGIGGTSSLCTYAGAALAHMIAMLLWLGRFVATVFAVDGDEGRPWGSGSLKGFI
jgi:hypothetical protein